MWLIHNDVTKDFAMQNEEEGLVVIAEEQKGKGRKGRAWASQGDGNMDVCFIRPALHQNMGLNFSFRSCSSEPYEKKPIWMCK